MKKFKIGAFTLAVLGIATLNPPPSIAIFLGMLLLFVFYNDTGKENE